jgi:hypothetical protein
MGSFGGGGDIEETPLEKETASIAMQKFNLLRPQLQEVEDQYIGRVQDLNKSDAYSRLNKDIAVTTGKQFDDAGVSLTKNLAAGGVDPTSGKYQGTLDKFSADAGTVTADSLNKGQTMQQDEALKGMGNVVAMGEGQSAESLSGMMSVANNSTQYARQKAGESAQNQSDKIGTLGFVAGAGYEMTNDDGGG